MIWLSVYFPALLIPSDQHAPLAIYQQKDNRIVQLNAAAKRSGVELHMGLGSASALCADLEVQPYCSEAERLRLTQIAMKLYPLNGDICLEASNELLIRCDRHAYYYGSQKRLLSVLLNEMKRLAHPFHFAIAHTPEQATLLARCHCDRILQGDAINAAVRAIHTISLPVSDKIKQQFLRVGMRTLDEIFQLAMPELVSRFSQSVIKYIYALKGLHKFDRNFYQPPEYFSENYELPFEIENHALLVKHASKLFDILETYLRSRNLLAPAVIFALTDNQKHTLTLTLSSSLPKYKANDWLGLLDMSLTNTTLTNPIRRFTLSCEKTLAVQGETVDLFQQASAHIDVHALFDRLLARLGEESVHLPSEGGFDVAQQWPTTWATPPFLFQSAQPLQQMGHIVAGPQRIQTQWWQDKQVECDYFLMETDQGQRLWVFRDAKQQWFVHGAFS